MKQLFSISLAAGILCLVPLLALGIPFGPVTALMLAALMVHGVQPGPMLIAQTPELFWGFIASMYVGNVMLLILNLPLVGLFVNVLRIPYPILYPSIIVFCVLGVYAVNNSVVDVWIMLAMGVLGYLLRKLDFETAPVVLGLVLAVAALEVQRTGLRGRCRECRRQGHGRGSRLLDAGQRRAGTCLRRGDGQSRGQRRNDCHQPHPATPFLQI